MLYDENKDVQFATKLMRINLKVFINSMNLYNDWIIHKSA